MPVVHQKVDAVFLGCDGIPFGQLHDLHIRQRHLKSARSTRIGVHHARDDHGGFLGDASGRLEGFRRDLLLERDPLDNTRAIANEQELQPSLVRTAVQPPLDGDLLANVLR